MHIPCCAVFDGGLYCPDCTRAILKMEITELPADARDRDGNPITVLYSWDIGPMTFCDACNTRIH
jgi:hypothetical protein